MKNKEVTIDFSKANELTQIAYAKVLGVVGPDDSLSPNILSSFCYSSDDIDVKIFQLLKENKFPMDHVGTVFYKEFIRKVINRIREGNLSNTMSLEDLIKSDSFLKAIFQGFKDDAKNNMLYPLQIRHRSSMSYDYFLIQIMDSVNKSSICKKKNLVFDKLAILFANNIIDSSNSDEMMKPKKKKLVIPPKSENPFLADLFRHFGL